MQENSKKTNGKPATCALKPCSSWLDQAFSTGILKKAAQLNRFNQQLKVYLPEPINQHCYLMDFITNEIIIGVDAAEWLISVRKYEGSIRTLVVSNINVSSTIKVKYLVRPHIRNVCVKKSINTQLSSRISVSDRNILRSIASTINDAQLKTALLNLADD